MKPFSSPLLYSFFFTILFFLPNYSIAQDCSCTISNDWRRKQQNIEEIDRPTILKTLKDDKEEACNAAYFEWMAEDLIAKKDFDTSLQDLKKAFDYYQKRGCNDASYLVYYKLSALAYYNSGNYDKAIESSFKLLPITEAIGNMYENANCLLQLSHAFNKMKESAKGIEYARMAMSIPQKSYTYLEKATLLSKLSSSYLWRYQDTKDISLLDTAEQLTKQLLQIAFENDFTGLLRKGYNMMNGYAHETKNYPKALRYIDSSLSLAIKAADIAQMATNYGDKADVLMEMKDYEMARQLADSCLKYHQLTNSAETIANAYALIYEISNRSENYKEAVDAMNSYITIIDSLTNAEKLKTINELEQKYNKAQNEKTIKELAQQKRIYLLLAVAGLFALIGLIFFIRQQSLKNKQKILEAEQRLNRARMNPHFFFNALSSLQSFAMEDNDGKRIAGNLSKFSHIMRETLESTYKDYVTIEQEADFLSEYLELQKIRYPGKFNYEITIDNLIEPGDILIPSMILQPFAENSIEHGFSGIDYSGHLSISFLQKEKELIIHIKDNGKGMVSSIKEDSEHISRASQIIKDRIYLLNIKLKTKAAFSIDNNKNEKGVTVLITLPLLQKHYIKK